MANDDSALYVVRFNTVTRQLEFKLAKNWVVLPISGGGGTPGGLPGNVQFNSAGTFGGTDNLTTDGLDLYINNGHALNLSVSATVMGSLYAYAAGITGNTFVINQANGGDIFLGHSTFTTIDTSQLYVADTVGPGAQGDPSAILQVDAGNKGFLPPRMDTTGRNSIIAPATGLEIYNTTTNRPEYYNGTSWTAFNSAIAVLSAATVGGAAQEEVAVAGLLTTSTILAVTQQTPGGAALPLIGWTNVLNGHLNLIYSADMGVGARVLVYFIP